MLTKLHYHMTQNERVCTSHGTRCLLLGLPDTAQVDWVENHSCCTEIVHFLEENSTLRQKRFLQSFYSGSYTPSLRSLSLNNIPENCWNAEAEDYLSEIGIPGVKDSGPEPAVERYLKEQKTIWINHHSLGIQTPSILKVFVEKLQKTKKMFFSQLTREKALIVWYIGLWRGTVLR